MNHFLRALSQLATMEAKLHSIHAHVLCEQQGMVDAAQNWCDSVETRGYVKALDAYSIGAYILGVHVARYMAQWTTSDDPLVDDWARLYTRADLQHARLMAIQEDAINAEMGWS